MTKKTAIILSIIMFAVLIGLLVCEIKNPAGGAAFLNSLFK